jgi:hypothetical protein
MPSSPNLPTSIILPTLFFCPAETCPGGGGGGGGGGEG